MYNFVHHATWLQRVIKEIIKEVVMEYSLSIKDILLLARQNIKTIFVFVVVLAFLTGLYGFIQSKPEDYSLAEKEYAEEQMDNYDKWQEKSGSIKKELEQELVEGYELLESHPFMQLDSSKIKKRRLVFTLRNDIEVTRSDTFRAWIDKLNCKQLFGSDKEILKKYRQDYISVYGDMGEVSVSIIDVPYYDYTQVAKFLEKYIKSEAKKNGIAILSSTNNVIDGFNQEILDRQDILRNNVIRIQNELNSFKNFEMDQPVGAGSTTTRNIFKIIVFILAGLLIGLVLGILFVLFKVIRKGTIISSDQITEISGLEKLAAGNVKDSSFIKVVSVVINAVTDNTKSVLILDEKKNEVNELINHLKKIDEREYVWSDMDGENIEVLNHIHDIEGIVTTVKLGETTFSEVQRAIRWSQKYKKNMLGYIVIE